MRVYWPTTLTALAGAVENDELAGAPATVHAVTRTLRDFYADADPRDLEEELEWVAMTDAAGQSLRLLADDLAVDPTVAARRVVLALDVPDAEVTAEPAGWAAPERSQVRVASGLRLAQVVSVHVDDREAEGDVRAAVVALPAADAGDDDATFALDQCESHDLLWYDASELVVLLAVGP
jgi:hypothetical protein